LGLRHEPSAEYVHLDYQNLSDAADTLIVVLLLFALVSPALHLPPDFLGFYLSAKKLKAASRELPSPPVLPVAPFLGNPITGLDHCELV
jgi:hypothetical protein